MRFSRFGNLHARWTVRRLLAFTYGVSFVVTLSLYTVLGLILVKSHVSTERRLLVQRIESAVATHQNEFLNELALSDVDALRSHIEFMRKDLNADLITLRAPNVQMESTNPDITSNSSFLHNAAALFFPSSKAVFRANISNEFKSIGADLEIGFSDQLYQQILKPSLDQIQLSLLFTLAIQGLLFFLLYLILNRALIQPLGHVSSLLKNGVLTSEETISTSAIEYGTLSEISDLLIALVDYQKLRKRADLADLAKQVSHDIRSPLTALEMLLPILSSVPENTRVVVRRALNRIRDIANTLLSPSSQFTRHIASENGPQRAVDTSMEIVLLVSVVEAALSEKRAEYRELPGIQIESKDCDSLYGVFVRADPRALETIFSNVINNSIEALGQEGTIQVTLSTSPAFAMIEILDNGPGILSDLLPILNSNPTTFNKEIGRGLGLKHAKEQVEKWHGSIEITSSFGNWTKVCLTVPRASPPLWHVQAIELNGISNIIVVDDDPSIHDVWEARFTPILKEHSTIRLSHAHSEGDLQFLVEKDSSDAGTLYLVDYELTASGVTGIDLITRFHLEKRSLLVTSRWNEILVRTKSEELGVRILPKEMANRVPIHVPPRSRLPNCILIDDDTTVGDWWNVLGASKGKSVHAFKRPQEFMEVAHQYPRTIPVYVDSKLGDEIKGEAVAEELALLGFTKVYLATGFAEESFSPMTFITAIRGKECPWEDEGSVKLT